MQTHETEQTHRACRAVACLYQECRRQRDRTGKVHPDWQAALERARSALRVIRITDNR